MPCISRPGWPHSEKLVHRFEVCQCEERFGFLRTDGGLSRMAYPGRN
jgi:hypothetical protein